jgi:hypothetical protein
MIATVIGTGATETVSTATDIQTLIAVIVRVLAHLNMIRTPLSVNELNEIGRRATGTTTVQDCLLPCAASDEMTIVTNVLAAALQVITTDVNAASVKLSVSDLMLAEPILVRRVSVCWIMAIVVVALRRLDAVGRATRARVGVIVTPRYVLSLFLLI